ncbi:MAG TPA: serine/threonine-protein kinase [Usitatibacteraceae bacterium]|nr:serine/threonine-protein kinase [Usitatibacteraceae bacterium]
MASHDPIPGLRKIPDNLPALLRPPGALPGDEARERLWNFVAIMGVVAISLVAMGWWSYGQVRESLRELRAAGLASLLEAETGVLTVWVEEKKRAAERWAADEPVQREAAALVRLAQGGMDAAEVCRSPARHKLLAQIAPFVALEDAVAVNLIARDGAIIAALHDDYCGLRVGKGDFAKRLEPVFSGKTVFVQPFDESERVGREGRVPFDRPLVWVETPVRGDAGEVIAALGFGRLADARFGTLLVLSSSQSSREAYAFDGRGVMLTQSRYLGDLRLAGRVPAGDSGILRIPVRDPGGDLLAGFRPTTPPSAWPPTRLAQAALEALASGSANEGAILEPYRDYRGTEVIGAWRVLREKDMVIAVEIEAAEAYAPLKYLEITFGTLLGFFAVAMAAAMSSSVWAMRLKLREARRVGPYTLEREIGEGGISHVYLARHSHLKRPVAVKVLKAALATDEMTTRFEREVQLCSRLSHPNTIEIYDYGRTREGTFYYAMEYLDGLSLEQLVGTQGRLPVSRAVHALRQVCGSLKEAHDHGLVHRDVKPHNLMLCRHGGEVDVVKVLDFGLVKEVANAHTRDITQFARVLGTPLYMAPERLRNPADADARADIYALGAVAFFLLTGRRVFETQSDHDLVYQVLNVPAPSIAECGAADAPSVLADLVARCLAKEREERPAGVAEVSAVLAEVARQRPWREEEARGWWADYDRRRAGEPAPGAVTAGRT